MTLHRFMTHLDVKHDIDIHKDTKDIMMDPDKLGPEMIQMFYYSMYLMAIVKTLIGMDLKLFCVCVCVRLLPTYP